MISPSKIFYYCSLKLKVIPPKFGIKKSRIKGSIAFYRCDNNTIYFHPRFFKRVSKGILEYHSKIVGYKFNNFDEYRFFIIAHEFSHYFQHTKYPKWLDKYYKSYLQLNKTSFEDYNKSKIEFNANKFALILLKKAKKEKIFLDLCI